MSDNIAVICTGDLEAVAEAFDEAAGHLAARARRAVMVPAAWSASTTGL